MKIYNYDSVTGEFINAVEAKPDPLDKGKYLIPAHATDFAPLEVANGYVPVFNKDTSSWGATQDHRGLVFYSEKDGSEVRITELGEIPEGLVTEEPLSRLKDRKLQELEQYHYRNTEVRTLTINGSIPFTINSKMRSLLQEQINYLGSTDKFNYYTEDGAKAVLTLAQLKKLHTKAMEIVNKNFQTYMQHKIAISRKKTRTSITNYNFKTNYLINQTFDL